MLLGILVLVFSKYNNVNQPFHSLYILTSHNSSFCTVVTLAVLPQLFLECLSALLSVCLLFPKLAVVAVAVSSKELMLLVGSLEHACRFTITPNSFLYTFFINSEDGWLYHHHVLEPWTHVVHCLLANCNQFWYSMHISSWCEACYTPYNQIMSNLQRF